MVIAEARCREQVARFWSKTANQISYSEEWGWVLQVQGVVENYIQEKMLDKYGEQAPEWQETSQDRRE